MEEAERELTRKLQKKTREVDEMDEARESESKRRKQEITLLQEQKHEADKRSDTFKKKSNEL